MQELTRSRLALGARLAKDGEVKRGEVSTDEKLRKRLLGKGYAKDQGNKSKKIEKPVRGSMPFGNKPCLTPANRGAESDSDEGGRSSLGKSRQDRRQVRARSETEPRVCVKPRKYKEVPRKASNYLDEVLADRTLQKQRRSEKKRKRVSSA